MFRLAPKGHGRLDQRLIYPLSIMGVVARFECRTCGRFHTRAWTLWEIAGMRRVDRKPCVFCGEESVEIKSQTYDGMEFIRRL